MRQLKICIINEFSKIFAQRKYKAIPVLMGVLILLASLISLIPGNVLYFSMDNYPYTIMSVFSYTALPIIAFMLASDLMAGEEERNELKILLLWPINRYSVVLGKLGAMIFYLLILLFESIVLSAAMSLIFSGFGGFNPLTVILSGIMTLLPIFMICGLALFLSTLVKTSTASFVLSIVAYCGIILLGLFLPSFAMVLPTGYMTIYKMILGSQIPWSSLLTGIAILCGFSIVFSAAANMRFEKKEI